MMQCYKVIRMHEDGYPLTSYYIASSPSRVLKKVEHVMSVDNDSYFLSMELERNNTSDACYLPDIDNT